ncbi:hypothetical protein C8N35_102436 [Breoghania corrubedonensis]|uniref:DUF6867 domain-containing protein n=1 Tax=Breoghania corrubedonensis TaxID=665038 RepID=A0A2T5VD87_9HYPH|nr:hypothetical protein [Breoghania corrubedonensis]PTW61720.1 hypothetical protein C8N35_102436 [Breoghania corrubedonensis]
MGIIFEVSLGDFLLVTVFLGGGAAWLTGRASALTWRPTWLLAWFLVLLSFAVRFLHYALFHGSLLSVHYWLIDLVVLAVLGFAGWRYTRTGQMATQYSWLYEKSSPFSWRERSKSSGGRA